MFQIINILLLYENKQTSLRENLNVLVKIQKITEIDKDGNESVITIFYKIKLIDRASLMTTSSSNFVDNPTEGMYKDCHFFLKYESAKDKLIKHKYLSCNKDCSRKIDEGLKKKIQGHM